MTCEQCDSKATDPLVDDETEELVRLGRAYRLITTAHHDPPPGDHDGWTMCLDAIYAEAARTHRA